MRYFFSIFFSIAPFPSMPNIYTSCHRHGVLVSKSFLREGRGGGSDFGVDMDFFLHGLASMYPLYSHFVLYFDLHCSYIDCSSTSFQAPPVILILSDSKKKAPSQSIFSERPAQLRPLTLCVIANSVRGCLSFCAGISGL